MARTAIAKVLGVDKARPALGTLVEKVIQGGEPVLIAKRSGKVAVLVSYEEFIALKALAEEKVKSRLRRALKEIRRAVRESQAPYEWVEEALQATRGLR